MVGIPVHPVSVNISFDFVHSSIGRINSIADLHKSSKTNRFTVFRLSSGKFNIYPYLTEIVYGVKVTRPLDYC